jgi:hypothetical protein
MSMSSISACGGGASAISQSRSQQLFTKLDVNGDSSVDASELRALTDFIGEKTGTSVDADALLTAIDSDGDGSVSSTELNDNVQQLFDTLRGQLMGMQRGPGGPPPGGPSPGDDAGRLLASLLEQYGVQSASASNASNLLVAAA